MSTYLTIHTRYKDVEIGLFKDGVLQDFIQDVSRNVSKNFIISIQTLLNKHSLKLEDLKFIAAHQGPAPFTTLRVSLASVNGLAFATHIPLIGINGLEVFLKEHYSSDYSYTIALLNAFCQDIYYGISSSILDRSHKPEIGCAHIEQFLKKVKTCYKGSIQFIGNGVELYKDLIIKQLGTQAIIPEPLPLIASLNSIGIQAYKVWQKGNPGTQQLMPLYLKSYSAEIITSEKTCKTI